jgi:hypothetical protein
MRTLRFIVDGQIIKQDPNCDFSNLVPGTEEYLQAEFIFSSDWSGFRKVAAFYSSLGREFPPQIIADGKTCVIPSEALKKKIFKVQVHGKRNDVTLATNKVAVSQNGEGV